jgi:formylmethanofuran dehydrogenase subunit E
MITPVSLADRRHSGPLVEWTLMRCQVCGRRTHELRSRYDKMVCRRCYNVTLEIVVEVNSF